MHEKLETALLLHQPLRKKYDFFFFFDVVTFESIEYERYEKENIHFFVPLTGPCMLAEKYIIDNTP